MFHKKVSVNAVKHIFISQMKSQGIQCSPTQLLQGKHAFLFSLRSLQPKSRNSLDVSIDFTPSLIQLDNVGTQAKGQKNFIIDPSKLLPSFSRGSQTKFNAFTTVSDKAIFQEENKAIVRNLVAQSHAPKQSSQLIMEARPRSTYCQICKETFSDYLKHLSHPVHIKKFQTQKKNPMLDDLIRGLQDDELIYSRVRPLVEDEQAEQQGVPCKIRVIQMQETLTPLRLNSSIVTDSLKNCNSNKKMY